MTAFLFGWQLNMAFALQFLLPPSLKLTEQPLVEELSGWRMEEEIVSWFPSTFGVGSLNHSLSHSVESDLFCVQMRVWKQDKKAV